MLACDKTRLVVHVPPQNGPPEVEAAAEAQAPLAATATEGSRRNDAELAANPRMPRPAVPSVAGVVVDAVAERAGRTLRRGLFGTVVKEHDVVAQGGNGDAAAGPATEPKRPPQENGQEMVQIDRGVVAGGGERDYRPPDSCDSAFPLATTVLAYLSGFMLLAVHRLLPSSPSGPGLIRSVSGPASSVV